MRAALLALLLTTTVGCASKGDAKPAAGSSSTEPSPATGERPRTASEQVQDKLTEAESALGEAKTKALIKLEAAEAELAKTQKGTATELQSAFDASDRRFIALKDQVANATKEGVRTASAEVAKREAVVMASIAKLRDATVQTWDATKTEVEADLSALDRSIEALEASLK